MNSSPVVGLPKGVVTVRYGDTGPSETVTLAGHASDDGLLGTLSYQWSVIHQPSRAAVTFGSENSFETTFSADKEGLYVLKLAASDGERTNSANTTVAVCHGPGGSTESDLALWLMSEVGVETAQGSDAVNTWMDLNANYHVAVPWQGNAARWEEHLQVRVV